MRFHLTLAFSQAHTAFSAANHAVDSYPGELEEADFLGLMEVRSAAIDKLLIDTPAITPFEAAAKLEVFTSCGLANVETKEIYSRAIMDDLRHQQSWPVSPPVLDAFAAWRAAYEPFCLVGGVDQEEENRLCEVRGRAYRVLMATPCTTAGDFMAKTYVNTLEETGHTLTSENKANGTGNLYDINIADRSDERDEGDVFARAAYADLDASDIGANLLAYGLPHFDAEKWMEAADRVGLDISTASTAGGSVWLGVGEEEAQADPRIIRERKRLERILSFDKDRTMALLDEIIREWPQLIHGRPADVVPA